jgi:hypothetical protein
MNNGHRVSQVVSKSLSVQRRLAQDSKAGRIAANIAKLPELLKKED